MQSFYTSYCIPVDYFLKLQKSFGVEYMLSEALPLQLEVLKR